ncbi:MAG: hypothetical protein PHO63_04870 [Bacilli bacterium]|nr:hypothetical protein [Bacilli bacterium]MDD4808792.1 hypothetical protein [Bacilli bacterium]
MLIKKVTFRIEESLYNQLKNRLSNQKEKISINNYISNLVKNDVLSLSEDTNNLLEKTIKELNKLSNFSNVQYKILKQLFANMRFAGNMNPYNDVCLQELMRNKNNDFHD